MNYQQEYYKYKKMYIDLKEKFEHSFLSASLLINSTNNKKHLSLKTMDAGANLTNNQKLAKYLSDFMKEHDITSDDYAIIAGYAVAQITGRVVTDLDVILSKDAYKKLLGSVSPESSPDEDSLSIGSAEITKTPRLFINSPFGEIEFFEREDTGFPSIIFSLRNLQENKMLEYDEFGNPYLNTEATILHYSEVEKIDGKLILGDGHEITPKRLQKNIKHLESINEKINSVKLTEKIESLRKLLD